MAFRWSTSLVLCRTLLDVFWDEALKISRFLFHDSTGNPVSSTIETMHSEYRREYHTIYRYEFLVLSVGNICFLFLKSRSVSLFSFLFLFFLFQIKSIIFVMRSLGLLFIFFAVAIMAELLLTESDPADVPEFVPTSPDNPPVPIPITPNIAFNSYDSGNTLPVDMNPVLASASTGIFSLDSTIRQEPSNDEMKSNIEPATLDADTFGSDNSLSPCNSVGTASNKQLQRQQGGQCVPLVDEDPSDQTNQGQKPKMGLTAEEIADIVEKERVWIAPSPSDPYWNSPEAHPCDKKGHPEPYCCLGPSKKRTWQPHRAETIVDVDNCFYYLLPRPFCSLLINKWGGRYCCEKRGANSYSGFKVLFWGLNCIPMFAGVRFDGYSPFEGITLP